MKCNFYIKPKKINLKSFRKEKNKQNYTKQIMIILLLILICITFFFGISLGKVIHNTNIKNNTEIANPILEVEKASEIIITEENKKGEYNFIVKNYNDIEEISQVDLQYYIEILENDLDKSIVYRLYKDDQEIKLTENKTEEIKIHKDIKEEQKYTLIVEYNANQNNVGDILQDIQIKVHSEQLEI